MRRRPAETSTAAGALAVLVGYVLGIRDPEVLVALTVVLGTVPAAVTWLVELVGGRQAPPVAHVEAKPRRRG